MLLIALALQSATVAVAADVPRPRIARSTLRRSARPVPKASLSLTACRTGDICGESSATSPFRLAGVTDPVIDRKLEMLHSAQEPSCGLIGMPVCPARGRQILRLGY